MHALISAMLVVVGLIHLLPMVGLFGSARLSALYGLPFDEPNLAILMRHRAALFGLLGLFFVVSAFQPAWQGLALFAGLASVLSFLWLAWSVGGCNERLRRVVIADVVALACLIVGGVAHVHRLPG